MTDDQRKVVFDKVGVVEEFLNNLKKILETQPLYKDSGSSVEECYLKIDTLKAETEPLVNVTTAPPKAEPTKTEEAKKEDEPMAEATEEAPTTNAEEQPQPQADAEMI